MSTAFAEEAVRIRDEGRLSDEDIARANGARPSTARACLALTRSPTGSRAERLVELSAIVDRLTRVIEPDYIPVWMMKPIPALGDEKPIAELARRATRG